MKPNDKSFFQRTVVIIVAVLILMPSPVFSGGATPQRFQFEPESAVGEEAVTSGSDKLVICPEPRPEMCAMDYRPVCAQLKDDQFKTYSNGCSACSDAKVVGYRQSACAAD